MASPLHRRDDDPRVLATPEDRYFDYCLQPYEPRRSAAGKLRVETLLWHSFDVAGAEPALHDAVAAIQRDAGRDLTVFGVKNHAGRIFWELYFYDPAKQDAAVRAVDITRTLAPYFRIEPTVRESVPYFMFSFDLFPDTPSRGVVDAVNLYLAEPKGQAGRSYRMTSSALEMENVYHFFHPKTDIAEVLYRIKSSVFVDYSRVELARVLLPELFSCAKICVAKKRRADAVYYSGISVDQLGWFLKRFAYPASIVAFVERHRDQLDHLRFDVGIDYFMNDRNGVDILKTSYYGTV